MGEKAFWIKAFVTNLGFSRIILGDTWLQEVNPQIDWPRRRITINKIHTLLTLLHREEMSKFTTRKISMDFLDEPLEMAETTVDPTHAAWAADARAKLDPWRYMMLLSNAGCVELAWMTYSTQIAQKLHKIRDAFKTAEEHIPVQYKTYLDVFCDRPNHRLPPR
jgi:hypothetical protein